MVLKSAGAHTARSGAERGRSEAGCHGPFTGGFHSGSPLVRFFVIHGTFTRMGTHGPLTRLIRLS